MNIGKEQPNTVENQSKFEKLVFIQANIKAPKGNFNSFGKYKYRSAEDILESVKPFLSSLSCYIKISDEIVPIGDRYYVKALATLIDGQTGEVIDQTTGWAREPALKKGMDEPQITGTTSSYARKYALNGLLALDDTKDSDTDEYHKVTNGKNQSNSAKPSDDKDTIYSKKETLYTFNHINQIAKKIYGDAWNAEKAKEVALSIGLNSLRDATQSQINEVYASLKGILDASN